MSETPRGVVVTGDSGGEGEGGFGGSCRGHCKVLAHNKAFRYIHPLV